LPIAEPQPAAAEALEELSAEGGVAVVPLRSLSPRELAQNSGLPPQQAELLRHPDFHELFFFAGASAADIERFVAEGANRHWQLRQRGVMWSLAVGANLQRCLRELSKLYARALRSRPKNVGIASKTELLEACDRGFLLVDSSTSSEASNTTRERRPARFREIELDSPDVWQRIVQALSGRA
jgi:hypothetical protein